MPNLPWKIMLLIAALLLIATGSARTQEERADQTQLLVESYDLLEAGKLTQAQKIFEKVLAQDPGNPLALNNLAAIKVKEKKYREALDLLQQALPRAQGYKVKVNRVCETEGICLAFRPLQAVYGDTDLAPLVRLNIEMVKARLATGE